MVRNEEAFQITRLVDGGDNKLTSKGTIVRVRPNELITDDPTLMRKIMAIRSPYTQGYGYKIRSGPR